MKLENNYIPELMTPQAAVAEAARCLGCDDAPCQQGCPAGTNVAKFIRQIAQKNFRGAIKTVREANVLAGTCALICPVGEFCEFKCGDKLERPIAIGALQRFAAEYERSHGMSLPPAEPQNGRSVGIIGSGPAGLSAAFELARLGFKVEIHEAEKLPGGILTYGIPAYRLIPEVLADEIVFIKAMAVTIKTEAPVKDLETFKNAFDAIFIGAGAYRPLPLNIKGEKLEGVYQAADYLKDAKMVKLLNEQPAIKLGSNVLVIGGGNTAIDAALSARFANSEVTLFYRRRREDMPAFRTEIGAAENHGVMFKFNYSPIEFRRSNNVLEAVFCRNKPGDVDQSGRPKPLPIDGSEQAFKTDTILIAIGQGATFDSNGLLDTDKHGLIVVDRETGATSLPGVYAGGDAVNGGTTAVQAVAEGKRAATGIFNYVFGK